MHKLISLSAYVKKRNGLPLGASGSMRNMLQRSLGAGGFHLFWHYWNPIWGYYLSRHVMKPLSQVFPKGLATVVTFSVSGGTARYSRYVGHVAVDFLFYPMVYIDGDYGDSV